MSAAADVFVDAPVGAATTLVASRCEACGRVEFPAVVACPACGGAVAPEALGPRAVLHGATEVLHPPPDAKVPVPYTLVTAAFPGTDLAVMGLLSRHVPVGELHRGAELEVCVVGYGEPDEPRTTYGFRPA